ncbi:MAG: right-handed parallel beta-helix repeat-containing protein [Polyangiaceae bacterium]
MYRSFVCAVAVTTLGMAAQAYAGTLSVGPGKTYSAPCAAFAAATDGDTIEVDSGGNYAGDVCALTKNKITIRGVGATRARIDAAGKNAQGKAIWVVQGADTVIENIEFSGATVPDENGAGIRQEGKNLTVRNCVFRDNQDGILAGDVAGSEILIEHCEFDHNGAGDGYSHNLYINHVAKLTFRYNYSHRAVIGHLLKSRAAENHILYNRFSDEADGTASYEIDCPNGGKTYVVGNIIEQNTLTDNPAMLAYLEEGSHASNPSSELFVVNNTFVNHLGKGTFIMVGAAATTPVVVQNNVFYGGGTPCSQASAKLVTNLEGGAGCFIDDAAFDYRLKAGSACVDAGSDPGNGGGSSLVATEQYVHPSSNEARPVSAKPDVGAFEYSDGAAAGGSSSSSSNGGTSSSTTSSSSGGTSSSTTPSTSAGSGGAPSTEGAESQTDEGCGCRTANVAARDGLAKVLLLLSAVVLAIGRRRSGHRGRNH